MEAEVRKGQESQKGTEGQNNRDRETKRPRLSVTQEAPALGMGRHLLRQQ